MATGVSRIAERVGLIAIGSLMLVACGTHGSRSGSGGPALGYLTGRVTAAPTCPVERIGHPCPPRPVIAQVQARAGDRVVASSRSDSDGSYRLELPGGTYMLAATTHNVFPRCTARTVTVTPAHTTSADITCDTGIR
jgi:hypothetical protein